MVPSVYFWFTCKCIPLSYFLRCVTLKVWFLFVEAIYFNTCMFPLMCLSVASSRVSPSQISPMGGDFLFPNLINKLLLYYNELSFKCNFSKEIYFLVLFGSNPNFCSAFIKEQKWDYGWCNQDN